MANVGPLFFIHLQESLAASHHEELLKMMFVDSLERNLRLTIGGHYQGSI
jgi:hypothetical protein